ncbi:MAG: hypothetical protein IJT24_04970 [Lachnospiraceae bacterium]|nr:hypothetical protein [Lachnospiraceae bacterium]
MAKKMNTQLSDEVMAKATGGIIAHISYGYICDGTVTSDNAWHGRSNGVSFNGYNVKGDDGKTYGCVWSEPAPPKEGARVSITHVESGDLSGCYEAKSV